MKKKLSASSHDVHSCSLVLVLFSYGSYMFTQHAREKLKGAHIHSSRDNCYTDLPWGLNLDAQELEYNYHFVGDKPILLVFC